MSNSKTFRLFISSTFSDFTNEREILQTEVFPYVEAYCQKKGYQFQPIDLRWGVNEEAQLNQKTLEVCLDEVKACKFHPHPNFLIMAGDRYGWIPLPYSIETTEFNKICKHVENNKKDINIEYPDVDNSHPTVNRKSNTLELLKQWYKKDENQIPVSYILQERTLSEFANYLIYENWEVEENILRNVLQDAAEKINLSSKEKYFMSATEQEVNEGIFNYIAPTKHQAALLDENPDVKNIDEKYVFSFIRSIVNNADYEDSQYREKNSENVENFKKNIKNVLLKDNYLELSTDVIDDNKLDLNYLAVFKKYIISFLIHSIDNQMRDASELSALDEELSEQQFYLEQKVKLFAGRENDKKVLHHYIDTKNQEPLIVYGKSGLGKSSLIAKIVTERIDKNTHRVIFRFIGATPQASDTKSVWLSILSELAINVQSSENSSLEEFSLRVYEELQGIEDNIVIFIDAVDQLYNQDTFLWLPQELPNNIKIIITTLKDDNYLEDSKSYELLQIHHQNFYKLTYFRIDSDVILSMLQEYGRTISAEQMQYVIEKYNNVESPLYLKVAIKELIHWKSSDSLTKVALADTQRGIIKEYITNLSSVYNHKVILIEKVMSYIYASVDGLSEKELLDFLSMDQVFVNEVAPQKFHKNISQKLPVAVWARLQFEIRIFITLKRIDGFSLMQFFHREFNDAIKEVFDTQQFHQELIEYTYEKILRNQDSFSSNRFGKLYIILVVRYAFFYNRQEMMEVYFTKLDEVNENWTKEFISYLFELIKKYHKGGQVLEATLMASSIQKNKKLFSIIDNQYEFIYVLAELELALGNTKEAEVLYLEALEYTKNAYDKAVVEIQIAKTFRKQGKTKEAKRLLENVLENVLKEDSMHRADALIQLGLCYFAFKEYDNALKHYTLADEYILTTNDRRLKLYNWLGISTVIAFMGQVQEGLDLLIKIKDESQQYGYQNFYIDSLNGISKKYLLFGQYEKAIEYGSKALDLGMKQGHKILVYLMNGYIVEAYAGLYAKNEKERVNIKQKVQKHMDDIEYVLENKLVQESLILELVNESVDKWKNIDKEKNE